MVQQLEAKFVNDYLMVTYPNKLQWKRVRLGALPKVDLAKLYKVTLHWTDAIVKDGSTIVLIEAKMRDQVKGIGQLELYREQFRETPEFQEYWELNVKTVLLVPIEQAEIRKLANQRNIEYIVYRPGWLKDFGYPV